MPSELEIDEWLQVGGDKLIEHKYHYHSHYSHRPERHLGKPQAVAALEAGRQPMHHHSDDKQQERCPIVGYNLRHLHQIPVRTYLMHHLAGRAPCHFVGLGRVEVGTTSEEETRETDEYEGEPGEPHGPCRTCNARGLRKQMQQGVAYQAHRSDELEHIDQRRFHTCFQHRKGCHHKDQTENVRNPTLSLPPLVHQNTQAVQSSPSDKIERRAVPHTTQQHGVHIVHVGAHIASVRGQQQPPYGNDYQHYCHNNSEPQVLQTECCRCQDDRQDNVARQPCSAIAAQRDIEVVAQPVRQRYVPTPPKVGWILGLIGRIEVEGQVEAHQHSHTYGNVGVAREVGIHLQRIEHQCREILKRRVERGVVKNPVDKIHRQIIAQHQLLHQSVQNPKHSNAELPARQEERLV